MIIKYNNCTNEAKKELKEFITAIRKQDFNSYVNFEKSLAIIGLYSESYLKELRNLADKNKLFLWS